MLSTRRSRRSGGGSCESPRWLRQPACANTWHGGWRPAVGGFIYTRFCADGTQVGAVRKKPDAPSPALAPLWIVYDGGLEAPVISDRSSRGLVRR
ncbi:hypothetical protein HPB50_021610 [Hyalomma asiaticum]|uniref:Uncharacterized protein n=1 Tax=Hyalomma asiaticum TaxID=266040 RepID=A0ACB7SYJ3_HYAAI|nr:hypothetical protein HPB50_021610 [Hyalomma asiaticum]